MPTPILMPALSPTMEEGTLAKWLVKEGDPVASGDVIAEIETDKATMEVEAVDEGRMGKILVSEGTEGVAVNAPIAVLLEEGEEESALEGYDPQAEKGAPAPASAPPEGAPAAGEAPAAASSAPSPAPSPAPATAQAGAENTSVEEKSAATGAGQGGYGRDSAPDRKQGNGAAPQPSAHEPSADEPSVQEAPAAPERNGERVFASPLARRLAADAGIDLTGLEGSGPRGRIVKADVEKARAEGPAKAPARDALAKEASSTDAPAPSTARGPAQLPFEEGAYTVEKPDAMRRTVAKRMTEAMRDVPHFYLTIDCEIDKLLKLRKELNAKSPEGDGAYKLSVNDFFIRASALALMAVPEVNSSWTEEGILRHHRADVAMAVAIDGGLITPIVHGADHKGLAAIANEAKELAQKARERKLQPHEYQGGTFSISNLGMFGIKHFTAVINPPHAAILALGAGEQRPVVKEGALAVATMVTCTMSCDHRVVDGAVGARFLGELKKRIEDPVTMLL